MLQLILAIFAIVCFCLEAFRVPGPVAWTPLGFALVTAAAFLA